MRCSRCGYNPAADVDEHLGEDYAQLLARIISSAILDAEKAGQGNLRQREERASAVAWLISDDDRPPKVCGYITFLWAARAIEALGGPPMDTLGLQKWVRRGMGRHDD